MIIALMVFLVVAGAVTGGFIFFTRLPESRKRRQLELRLQEVSRPDETPEQSVVVRQHDGPLPSVEKLIGATRAGSHLSRLIEQAGVNTSPSALLLASLLCAAVAALAA